MKRSLILTVLLVATLHVCGADPTAQPLYPKGAPDANGVEANQALSPDHEVMAEADYYLFPADPMRATGQGVVICPGGGYGFVSYHSEGTEVARWLNEQGVTALVLRYRMPNGHKQIPMEDACAAMRLLRRKAHALHVDPHQVGIMGFSAGGHLATTVATHADRRAMPDFEILFYPVVTFEDAATHGGTRSNLLGENPSPEEKVYYSNEKQVSAQTPRAFIALCDDDPVVPPINSINYYNALRSFNIPAELHVYPTGGHGWGWNPSFHDQVLGALAQWLVMIQPPKQQK